MLWAAIQQTWEPFVLVVGLLLIGHVASSDGLFEVAGSKLSRLRGGTVVLFVAMMLLVAVVTAALNLDTSVVFLTPVLLQTARHRSVNEEAFLYGSIFMANAASLLLLGSNLTNILVFARSNVTGAAFARTMFVPWILSVALTTIVVLVWRWRDLKSQPTIERQDAQRFALGPGVVGVVAAVVLMLVLSRPAVAVLAVALVVAAVDVVARHRVAMPALVRSANLSMVVGLFILATTVSVASRYWHVAQHLIGTAGSWQTAGVAAAASNVINNLPAAAMLSAKFPAHPYGLLFGLNLGPNLTVIGALSSMLWLKVARREGASPSAWTFTK
ncbi:MAG TPA: SLC13 family permease, partial [Acidimicrobiales bacterium]